MGKRLRERTKNRDDFCLCREEFRSCCNSERAGVLAANRRSPFSITWLDTYAGKALIVPVDVEINKDLVRDFRIRLIPTQIFLMPDRTEFFRHEGILQEQQISEILGKMGVQ